MEVVAMMVYPLLFSSVSFAAGYYCNRSVSISQNHNSMIDQGETDEDKFQMIELFKDKEPTQNQKKKITNDPNFVEILKKQKLCLTPVCSNKEMMNSNGYRKPSVDMLEELKLKLAIRRKVIV
jgi:hypothetical protein